MRGSSRPIKKLRSDTERASGPSTATDAGRNLVPGRSAHRPEERPRPAMGSARNAAPSTRGSALRKRLSLWRDLPGSGHGSGAGAASRRHRDDATPHRGNLSPRRKGRACCVAARSRGMAHDREARHTQEHNADPLAVSGAGTQSGRERLAISSPKLALEHRLRKLRSHYRRRLRRMAKTHRSTRDHHINRHARLGSYRSDIIAGGINPGHELTINLDHSAETSNITCGK